MIRFCCTKCGREHLLADAFAHLPLLCKGCGDRIIVPTPSESLPEPPPPPPVFEEPVKKESLLSEQSKQKLQTPLPESQTVVEPPRPAAPPDVLKGKPDRTRVARLVDIAVFILVLAIGMFVGERVAGKSTLQIFSDAPASPKFPPTDLVLWVGCVAAFGLLDLWLGTRGWTVGGWLKRR